jgi:hypothetical protein
MRSDVGLEAWALFRDEMHYEPTINGFKAAWLQMTGKPAPEAVVDAWWKKVERMAEDAGYTFSTTKGYFVDRFGGKA